MSPILALFGILALCMGVTALIVIQTLRSFRDPCPEDGCRGFLRFDRNEIRDGIPVSIWKCSHCPIEHVISVQTDPTDQYTVDGGADVSPPRP